MTIHEHLTEFAGLRVADFAAVAAGCRPAPEDPVAWRVGTHFEGAPLDAVFEGFLREVDTTPLTALVIGYWGASYDDHMVDPVRVLCEAADRLPSLRALFLGDIVMEEQEISWIEQSDVAPLMAAFPLLERLEVRGCCEFAPIRSEALKTLRFESGGLPAAVVRAVAASDLPALQTLELWLGDPEYGGDATVADVSPILTGERLPALRHLGLANSALQDEIAAAVAGAPVMSRLESLSLAMGVLTDKGAEALLAAPPTHLKSLDLRHHYLGEEMMDRLRAALPGVAIDLGDRQESDGDWRYVAISE